MMNIADAAQSSNVFAIAISHDAQYLAGVTESGHVKVWDLNANGLEIHDYETNGAFGISLAWVRSNASSVLS